MPKGQGTAMATAAILAMAMEATRQRITMGMPLRITADTRGLITPRLITVLDNAALFVLLSLTTPVLVIIVGIIAIGDRRVR